MVLLLVGGAVLARVVGGRLFFDPVHALILRVVAIATIGVLAVRPLRQGAIRAMNHLRAPSPGARRTIAVVLTLAAAAYLYQAALGQGRRFQPVIHDEYCYLIQSRMLAAGHLWMPRHDAGEFFDSFHLITDRAYAAKYGPGAALFFAPVIAAGLPYWLGPLALTALSVGLVYLLITHWIDGLAGLLAVLMLPTLQPFRRVSIEALSQPPLVFLTLVALWAMLHWRRDKSIRWMVVMSAAVGWAAITRPADAAALGLPLALGVLLGLRGSARTRWISTVLTGLAAAAPFLALQAIYDKGVTGSWTTLPWTYYASRNDPCDRLLTAPPGSPDDVRPDLTAPKRTFNQTFTRPRYEAGRATPMFRRFWHDRLVPTLQLLAPHALLLALLPLGVLGAMCSRGRWIAAGFVLTFLGVYAQYPFYYGPYALAIAAPVFLMLLAGWDALAAALPRVGDPVRFVSFVAILALVVISLPEMQRVRPGDEWQLADAMREYDDRLAILQRRPSLVLFHFDPASSNPHCEPVYNADVAWPDDAQVIRAHDLGPTRNRKLFDYYARLRQDRDVYLYDRSATASANPLRHLGKISELTDRTH
ncbi:MAG TPA: hypothetical protein VH475_14030 [Tepidisphaeraceae bacterium]